jgi:uncharacterized protein
VVKVGDVQSRHIGAAPELAPPPSLEQARAAELLDVTGLAAAAAESDGHASGAVVRNETRALRRFIRDPAFPLSARVYPALASVAPNGLELANLAQHLRSSIEDAAAAVALLEQAGAADILDVDGTRLIRLSRAMLIPAKGA